MIPGIETILTGEGVLTRLAKHRMVACDGHIANRLSKTVLLFETRVECFRVQSNILMD